MAKWGKIGFGVLLSLLFLWLAFARVHPAEMGRALRQASWGWLLPAMALLFAAHWLRALRWRFLLEPVQRVPTGPLLAALLIGYMCNVFLPAHLGELVRANLLGRQRRLPPAAVLASVVVERLIDVFSLLALFGLAMALFPFPAFVRISGLAILAASAPLFLLLLLMRRHRNRTLAALAWLGRPLPRAWQPRLQRLANSFLDGLVPLGRWHRYPLVALLSVAIWLGYLASYRLIFFAFPQTAALSWMAALVLLVITSLSVLVPSTPGYVGPYHALCRFSLGLFAVPAAPALSFAFVLHAVNFLPVLLAGLALVLAGGVRIGELRRPGESPRPSARSG